MSTLRAESQRLAKLGTMHIAVIIERFTPESGGAERSTSELVAEMRLRGHAVTILTGKATASGVPAGTAVRLCPRGQPKGVMRLRYFRRWVQGELAAGGFDGSLSVAGPIPATVVEPRAGLIPDIQARALAWRPTTLGRAIKRVALAMNPRQHMLRRLERETFHDPSVKHVVCISRMIFDRCGELYPQMADKRRHIPNAVKPVAVTAEETGMLRRAARQGWGASDSQTVFLFPALDSRRKGLTPLLHSFALLRREHPELAVLLVLAGKMHASQLPLIERLGLRDVVRDVGMQKDPRPLYAGADVTVVPTYYDTFARVGIESLQRGRPAITTAFDGAAEMIEPADGPRRGRVVADPDNHAALARAMFELCDPVERERCVAAVGEALDGFTTARHVERLLALLGG